VLADVYAELVSEVNDIVVSMLRRYSHAPCRVDLRNLRLKWGLQRLKFAQENADGIAVMSNGLAGKTNATE
jgi:hypothetical protein